jgi:hypothetical protein
MSLLLVDAREQVEARDPAGSRIDSAAHALPAAAAGAGGTN